MLDNMCYCEDEMLALNMVRLGLFGEIVHGEGAYIHDSRASFLPPDDPNRKVVFNNKVTKGVGPDPWTDYWAKKHGALYSMHGLGPIARCLEDCRAVPARDFRAWEDRPQEYWQRRRAVPYLGHKWRGSLL